MSKEEIIEKLIDVLIQLGRVASHEGTQSAEPERQQDLQYSSG
jgi:hypothetical protein